MRSMAEQGVKEAVGLVSVTREMNPSAVASGEPGGVKGGQFQAVCLARTPFRARWNEQGKA
jgi:hypothetical protein